MTKLKTGAMKRSFPLMDIATSVCTCPICMFQYFNWHTQCTETKLAYILPAGFEFCRVMWCTHGAYPLPCSKALGSTHLIQTCQYQDVPGRGYTPN